MMTIEVGVAQRARVQHPRGWGLKLARMGRLQQFTGITYLTPVTEK